MESMHLQEQFDEQAAQLFATEQAIASIENITIDIGTQTVSTLAQLLLSLQLAQQASKLPVPAPSQAAAFDAAPPTASAPAQEAPAAAEAGSRQLHLHVSSAICTLHMDYPCKPRLNYIPDVHSKPFVSLRALESTASSCTAANGSSRFVMSAAHVGIKDLQGSMEHQEFLGRAVPRNAGGLGLAPEQRWQAQGCALELLCVAPVNPSQQATTVVIHLSNSRLLFLMRFYNNYCFIHEKFHQEYAAYAAGFGTPEESPGSPVGSGTHSGSSVMMSVSRLIYRAHGPRDRL